MPDGRKRRLKPVLKRTAAILPTIFLLLHDASAAYAQEYYAQADAGDALNSVTGRIKKTEKTIHEEASKGENHTQEINKQETNKQETNKQDNSKQESTKQESNSQENHTQESGSNQENSSVSGGNNATEPKETLEDTSLNSGLASESEPEAEQSIATDSQGIIYHLDGDTCYVSGYTKDIQSSVAIPAQLETGSGIYTVKGIHKQAFSKCSRLQKIELPATVTDLSKGIFSECKNLTSITVNPAAYSIKKNGKISAVGIKINSVLLGEADHTRLKIRKDLVTEAAAQKGTEQITISIQAVSSNGVRYASPEQIEFDADAAQALSKCGKSLKVKLIDTDGEKYYITMAQNRLKQLQDGWKLKLRKQKAGDTTGAFASDLQKALQKNGIAENKVLVYQATLPNESNTGTDLLLPVTKGKAMEAGSAVYVYRYSTSKRDFRTVLYHPAVVSKQGNIRLSLDKGGVYILSAKPLLYMCRKLTNTFITETGSTYYIGKDGQPVCGWKQLGDSYYYFDRKTGKMASGRTIDGIRLKKSGQAAASNAEIQKIQTMIKARQIVLQVTKPDDTLEEKIRKCFLWVFQFPYRRYRRLSPICRQAGWEVTFANDIFDKRQGCCVSEASATAFLFHECGCETVYVATDTGHAWVELNGRVYDPLFAEARGFNNYYNRSYEGYGMYAVVKHKI